MHPANSSPKISILQYPPLASPPPSVTEHNTASNEAQGNTLQTACPIFLVTPHLEMHLPPSSPTLSASKSHQQKTLAISTADSGIAGISAMGISFACFNRRETKIFASDFRSQGNRASWGLKLRDSAGKQKKSRSASGGCLQGGASFKGEKAHFAAWKNGPEN